jgi:Golgi phosphoprotein 3
MNTRDLKLYEEILLLALDDDAGTIEIGSQYNHAMAGAILAELLLDGALKIEEDGKKKLVRPGARAGTLADPILGEALGKVLESSKPKQAKDWVMKFAGLKHLKNRAARQLVARGVLAEETDQVLLLFRRTVFPERDGGPEAAVRARLERAVFSDADEVDPRTTVILALLKASSMLNKVLGKRRVKERKERIDAIINGDVAGKATREAIQAMQAAVMVCTVVPVIVAAS